MAHDSDLELDLVTTLCNHVNRQISPQDLPPHLRQDLGQLLAILYKLKARGAAIPLVDTEGGVPELVSISVRAMITEVRRTLIEEREIKNRQSGMNIQVIGNDSVGIQGNQNTINNFHPAAMQELGNSVEALLPHLERIQSSSNAILCALLELKSMQQEAKSSTPNLGRIQKLWGTAKPVLEKAALADGVLGLLGKISSLIQVLS